MINDITKASKSDAQLAGLLDEARDCAHTYLLVKQRHKGCTGKGEFVTFREELQDMIRKLAKYCGEKGYQCDLNADDPDAAAHKLTSEQP
jgi:hypothetical protein